MNENKENKHTIDWESITGRYKAIYTAARLTKTCFYFLFLTPFFEKHENSTEENFVNDHFFIESSTPTHALTL